jgi:hypothetical protein
VLIPEISFLVSYLNVITLTLREEHRLRVWENRVLRRIYGRKRRIEKTT